MTFDTHYFSQYLLTVYQLYIWWAWWCENWVLFNYHWIYNIKKNKIVYLSFPFRFICSIHFGKIENYNLFLKMKNIQRNNRKQRKQNFFLFALMNFTSKCLAILTLYSFYSQYISTKIFFKFVHPTTTYWHIFLRMIFSIHAF